MSQADDHRADADLVRRARASADRRARTAPPAAADDVDDLRLAAWLDGRLDEGERDAVDAALAARPELVDRLLDARAALATPAIAQARSVERAQALVRRRRAWPLRLATAAALVAALAGGYWSGAVAAAPDDDDAWLDDLDPVGWSPADETEDA
ncbi:MAG TPA: hypothetical protein VEL07_10465 [Planctomycetota bacterium]|nr:hypothetical protein [Planctomycetota bacterium]